jgi:hypothetical protein
MTPLLFFVWSKGQGGLRDVVRRSDIAVCSGATENFRRAFLMEGEDTDTFSSAQGVISILAEKR